jgi:biopolymer transport protein ExbB
MIAYPLLASFHSMLHFFVNGGFFMFLLLLCSVASVTVIFLRGAALRRKAVMPPLIESSIEDLQPAGDPEVIVRLSRLVRGDMSPLGKIVQVGLRHLQWPKAENMEAVQTRARHEIVRMESGLVVLEVIVGIAPLLGLLGAVSGLVTVFANLGDSASVSDPRGIAKGISEALSTTVVGMAVAIPTLIAYSYFSKKIETMSAEMESIIADMLAKCYFHKQKRLSQRGSQTGPLSDFDEMI